MWDYLFVFLSLIGDVARSKSFDRGKNSLISALHFHLSEGGARQHLIRQQFVLFNGSLLTIHIRSYNNQDLKSHSKILNINSRSNRLDFTRLSL